MPVPRNFKKAVKTAQGVTVLIDMVESQVDRFLNGKPGMNEMFVISQGRFIARNYQYLSALEGYICLRDANVEGVIAYIKGDVDSVDL